MTGDLSHKPTWQRYIAYPLQALLAFAAYGLFRLLPLDAASGLGGWIGRTMGPRLGISRRARRNLGRAFPEKAAGEIEAILRGMWDNLGRTALEFTQMDRLARRAQAEGRIEAVGRQYADRLRDDGRPGILFSGHFGNWELTPILAYLHGIPVHFAYRAPNNPFIDRLLRSRRIGGGEGLAKGSLVGARLAYQVLRKGEHLGMLVDQKFNQGIPVPFFGRPAMTAPALAVLALRIRCPVMPVRVERLTGARFRVTCYEPLELPDSGDRKADVVALMTRVNRVLEGWIRERPDQWFWLHNRWPD